VRGQGPLTLWFDGKYIDTSSTKIATSGSREEKKNFPRYFNITSMGEKLISKNHLNPAPTPFLLRFRLEINKNQGMILGKFKSGARPGT
jgi:hypothetical protein